MYDMILVVGVITQSVHVITSTNRDYCSLCAKCTSSKNCTAAYRVGQFAHSFSEKSRANNNCVQIERSFTCLME